MQAHDKSKGVVIAFKGRLYEDRFYTHNGRYQVMVKRTSMYGVEIGLVDTFEENSFLTVRTVIDGTDTSSSATCKGNNPIYIRTEMGRYSDVVFICLAKSHDTEELIMFAFRRTEGTFDTLQLNVVETSADKQPDVSAFIYQGRA